MDRKEWLDFWTEEYRTYISLTGSVSIIFLTAALVLAKFDAFTTEVALAYITAAVLALFYSLHKAYRARDRMLKILWGSEYCGFDKEELEEILQLIKLNAKKGRKNKGPHFK